MAVLIKFLNGRENGAEDINPRSFANATADPVSVIAPMRVPRCAVTSVMVPIVAACSAAACMKCAIDVDTAAKPTCVHTVDLSASSSVLY
jgi:hypothetical protein